LILSIEGFPNSIESRKVGNELDYVPSNTKAGAFLMNYTKFGMTTPAEIK
jgi:hypothetical protein